MCVWGGRGGAPRRPGPQQSPLRLISDPLAISTDTNENCLAPGAVPSKSRLGPPQRPPDPCSAPSPGPSCRRLPPLAFLLLLSPHPWPSSARGAPLFPLGAISKLPWGHRLVLQPHADPCAHRGDLPGGGGAEALPSRQRPRRPGSLRSRRWGGARGARRARSASHSRRCGDSLAESPGAPLSSPPPPRNPLPGAPPPPRPPGRGSEPRRASPPRHPLQPHLPVPAVPLPGGRESARRREHLASEAGKTFPGRGRGGRGPVPTRAPPS